MCVCVRVRMHVCVCVCVSDMYIQREREKFFLITHFVVLRVTYLWGSTSSLRLSQP